MGAIKPTSQTELIVDEFIKIATQHLTTVSGIVTTTSLYPPASTPGPGVIFWTGYFVPPSTPTPPLPNDVAVVDTSAFEMTDAQLADAQTRTLEGFGISESTAMAFSGVKPEGPVPDPIGSTFGSLKEYAENAPTNLVSPGNMPIDGIEKIPNYKTSVKVPPELVLAMRKYGVGRTPIERAHFLAQVAHESMNFFYKEEIASGIAYEGDKRLGNNRPGDGVRFKGRGYIQLTGRYNYTKFGPMVGADLVSNPLLVSQKYYADVSCLFWKVNGIGAIATNSSYPTLVAVTKCVNGRDKGIDDRAAKFKKYWTELQRDPTLWQ